MYLDVNLVTEIQILNFSTSPKNKERAVHVFSA